MCQMDMHICGPASVDDYYISRHGVFFSHFQLFLRWNVSKEYRQWWLVLTSQLLVSTSLPDDPARSLLSFVLTFTFIESHEILVVHHGHPQRVSAVQLCS